MSLLDLGPVIFGDIDRQIAWFQSKHLLPRQATCSSCGAANKEMIFRTKRGMDLEFVHT